MDSKIRFPKNWRLCIDAAALDFLNPDTARRTDFSKPPGEQALISPDSVSWRVFKNPVALWIGGVAAVILELAEPAVRDAIWQHSSFRQDPLGRLRRTGRAAMVTVYAPCSVSKPLIASVVRMHANVQGAQDPELLSWVQATAAFGFCQAYDRYVKPLPSAQIDQFYREGAPVSLLYGAVGAPRSAAEVSVVFDSMRDRLEGSESLFQFLEIMSAAPLFPWPLRSMQKLMVRAAVDLIPKDIRVRLGLTRSFGLRSWEWPLAHLAGSLANRIVLPQGPAAQACLRLGLPVNRLYV
jgi:uncharacterized protein (DUF2236 family)